MKKLFFLFLVISACGRALAAPDAPGLKFTDLSPAEQLGQTLSVAVDVDNPERFRSAIENGQVGSVLIQWGNYSLSKTQDLINKLQKWAANSPHHIPLLISIDYEGGTVYTPITLGFDYLPTNMMLSAAADENLTASVAYLAATELKRTGVHINFSPVLDVNSNPNNPIIGVRSFGSNSANVTKMGLALMNGFQAAGIISVVKHFPGHGDTEVDSHYQVPIVAATGKNLKRVHIEPFAQAIAHGARGVMTSHIIYPALDPKQIATFSPTIVGQLLQKQLGFKGLIITDSLDMKAATTFCSIADCAVKSLLAGSDLILLGHYVKPKSTFEQLYAQMQQSPALQQQVKQASSKIFQLKQDLGLLTATQEEPAPIDQVYRQTLRHISRRAVTLVRNRSHLLPVSVKQEKAKKPLVCAIFFAPSRFADQLLPFTKPFLEKGWTVRTYNAALTPKAIDMKRARQCASEADLVVLTSLQWADKPNASQKNTLQTLLKENPHAVLISTMSPYDIIHYPTADTVLATYGLNKYVLQTAADIILGNQKPLGTLPVELPEPDQELSD